MIDPCFVCMTVETGCLRLLCKRHDEMWLASPEYGRFIEFHRTTPQAKSQYADFVRRVQAEEGISKKWM